MDTPAIPEASRVAIRHLVLPPQLAPPLPPPRPPRAQEWNARCQSTRTQSAAPDSTARVSLNLRPRSPASPGLLQHLLTTPRKNSQRPFVQVYLLSTYCVPGTVPGAVNTRNRKSLSSWDLHSSGWRHGKQGAQEQRR